MCGVTESKDGLFGIFIGLWTGPFWVRILAGARDFSLIQNAQTTSGFHPPSYKICSRGCVPWDKVTGA